MNFKKTIALLPCLAIAACATQDPYSGEKETSKAAKGASLGAVAGAMAGAATAGGNKRESIVTGAIAGAALGGGIGLYMDRQEAKLREELQGTGVQIQRDGDVINLIMPGNITFATGQSAVRGDFYPALNSVAKILEEFEKTKIVVSGHTDNVGNAQFNQKLSEDRAQSVESYLVTQGVKPGRIEAVGYGLRRPVASNASASGREQNRRVELKLEAI